MSKPATINGNFWNIGVSVDGGQSFTAVCGLTSKGLNQSGQTSDDYTRDCSDPYSIPVRQTNITGKSASMSGQGTFDRKQGDLLRSIFLRKLPTRFIQSEDAADSVDSGYWQGVFVLTQMDVTAPDGNVTNQLTWQNDGDYIWVPNADIVVLDPLFLAPHMATHGTAYTGTINGKTTGSTIAATSSDGTTLTVSGTTLTGTFPNAGPVTVTLTETLAAAPNSPKVTSTQLNVS